MANVLEELRDALTKHLQGEDSKAALVDHVGGIEKDVADIKAALVRITDSPEGSALRTDTNAITLAVAALEAKNGAVGTIVDGANRPAPSVFTPADEIDNRPGDSATV